MPSRRSPSLPDFPTRVIAPGPSNASLALPQPLGGRLARGNVRSTPDKCSRRDSRDRRMFMTFRRWTPAEPSDPDRSNVASARCDAGVPRSVHGALDPPRKGENDACSDERRDGGRVCCGMRATGICRHVYRDAVAVMAQHDGLPRRRDQGIASEHRHG